MTCKAGAGSPNRRKAAGCSVECEGGGLLSNWLIPPLPPLPSPPISISSPPLSFSFLPSFPPSPSLSFPPSLLPPQETTAYFGYTIAKRFACCKHREVYTLSTWLAGWPHFLHICNYSQVHNLQTTAVSILHFVCPRLGEQLSGL